MNAGACDVVPTRLVDLSCVGLGDLARCDPDEVARISAVLVGEVTSQAEVSLAGSNS